MEKIKLVLGVPYSLEIGTNDPSIGKCDGELCITMSGYRIAIPLKHVDGIKYTVKIPKTLKDLVNKKLKYKLYVYAESARFLVENGNLDVISEKTFDVKNTDVVEESNSENNKTLISEKKIIQIDESEIKEKVNSKMSKRKSLLDGVIKESKAFSELDKLKEDNKRRKEKREIKEAEHKKKLEKNKKIQESLKKIKK